MKGGAVVVVVLGGKVGSNTSSLLQDADQLSRANGANNGLGSDAAASLHFCLAESSTHPHMLKFFQCQLERPRSNRWYFIVRPLSSGLRSPVRQGINIQLTTFRG
jgi:hypothetical protein